ncbi:MAG: GNAT family N-acetyltransferase, partial [Cyanobacteria bacterium J06626_4]
MGTSLTYLPVVETDCDRLFDLHKVSLGPYVEQIFGWEDNRQRQLFNQNFIPENGHWICTDQIRVGVVIYKIYPERFYLEKIEIYPEFQRQGYGSQVIVDIISQADEKSLPVELQVFKINPAIALYKRLGFAQLGETNFHVQL